MGDTNAQILLEWAGITVEEDKPQVTDQSNVLKLDQFLAQETIRFENAHPIVGSEQEAA